MQEQKYWSSIVAPEDCWLNEVPIGPTYILDTCTSTNYVTLKYWYQELWLFTWSNKIYHSRIEIFNTYMYLLSQNIGF